MTGPNLPKRSPNIMLFTCSYGAGHKMATQGLVESLPDCNIQGVDIYDAPLRSLDPLRSISSKISNKQIYNDMAKNEHNRLLNVIGKIAPKTLLWQRRKVVDLLTSYISQQKPDMLISCIPLVNPILVQVAKQFDIPLLVVTTDILISIANAEKIARGGRARWKIENETFNTRKNLGYNFEHTAGTEKNTFLLFCAS